MLGNHPDQVLHQRSQQLEEDHHEISDAGDTARYKKETASNVTLACDDDQQIKAHKVCWCHSFCHQTQDELHQVDFLGTNAGTQVTIKTVMVVEFRVDLALKDANRNLANHKRDVIYMAKHPISTITASTPQSRPSEVKEGFRKCSAEE